MTEEPVRPPGTVRTPETSTPRSWSRASMNAPNASSPTTPTMPVAVPSRARPQAVIATALPTVIVVGPATSSR